MGLKLHPVAFDDRIANSDLNSALADAAQFQMEHTYAMTYGGDYEGELAHFQPDYLACDICDAQIVFKAFLLRVSHWYYASKYRLLIEVSCCCRSIKIAHIY